MLKKMSLVALVLLMLPTLAQAATYKVFYKASPMIAGTVTPVPNPGMGYVKVTAVTGTANFKASKNFGYSIVTPPSVTGGATVSAVAADGTFSVSNVTTESTVTVTYLQAPGLVSSSVLPTNQTVLGSGISNVANFAGSFSVSPVGAPSSPATYAWSVSPSAGAHLTAGNSPTAQLYVDAYGDYTVSLIATVAGVSSSSYSVLASFQSPGVGASAVCIQCHNGRDPLVVDAYKSSKHINSALSSCDGCHQSDLASGYMGNKDHAVCLTCHTVATSAQAAAWNGSKHKSTTYWTNPVTLQGGVKCADCHNPHSTVAGSSSCLVCHSGQSDTLPLGIQRPNHYAVANVPGNWNNPAFAAYTGGPNRAAQYYTPNSPCSGCHEPHGDLTIVQAQWMNNLHAVTSNVAPSHFVWTGTPALAPNGFGSMGVSAGSGLNYQNNLSVNNPAAGQMECVRCHTKTGFVNFVTSNYATVTAWQDPTTDKAKEVLSCGACHTDTVGTVRTVAAWTPYLGYSTAANQRSGSVGKFVLTPFTVSSLGKSDVCASCHSHGGKSKTQISGNLVKQLNTFNSYSVVRANIGVVGSHGTAIAAVPVLTSNGFVYKFPTKSYDLGSHNKIGSVVAGYPDTGTAGPCAGCHMGTDKTGAKGGHNFVAWRNWSSSTAEMAKTVCNQCHPQYSFIPFSNATQATAKMGAFATQSSVKRVLRFNLGYTATQSLTAGAGNAVRFYSGSAALTGDFRYDKRELYQGAHLNTTLTGSWWIHGPLLAQQLLFDSLDVALHGHLTGSVADLGTFQTAHPTYLTAAQAAKTIAWFGGSGSSRPIPQ